MAKENLSVDMTLAESVFRGGYVTREDAVSLLKKITAHPADITYLGPQDSPIVQSALEEAASLKPATRLAVSESGTAFGSVLTVVVPVTLLMSYVKHRMGHDPMEYMRGKLNLVGRLAAEREVVVDGLLAYGGFFGVKAFPTGWLSSREYTLEFLCGLSHTGAKAVILDSGRLPVDYEKQMLGLAAPVLSRDTFVGLHNQSRVFCYRAAMKV